MCEVLNGQWGESLVCLNTETLLLFKAGPLWLTMSGGIVAICQYGGKFETDSGGSMSYTGGEAHAIDIDRNFRFEDFKSEIASVFNIDVSNVAIKYFLPNNNRTLITISCDKDLQRVIDFYANSGCIDIYILNMAESRVMHNMQPGTIISATPIGTDNNAGRQKRIPTRKPGGRNVRSKAQQANQASTEVPALPGPNSMREQSQNASGRIEMRDQDLAVTDDLQYLPALAFSDDIITGVGQEFDNVKDFRDRLCEYAISKGFVYRYVKNESIRVTAKCNAENCPWRIHASQTPRRKKFVIKKLIDVHTCGGGRITSESQVRITKKWLVNVIREKLIENPDSKPKEMAEEIYRDYGVNVSYFQVWHGKNDAEKELYKMHVEACDLLPWFCEKILESNPGSVVTLATSSDSRYRVFVSFHACRSGFECGCRPLIFLDRIPLKKNNHVKLLVAAAVDGDDGIYPIAFAAVEAEIYDSWFWFLEQLKDSVTTSFPLTFVSNTRNGLDEAVPQVFKDSYHAYSVLHLVDDFRSELNKGLWSQEVKDAMVKDLECAAEACLAEDFNAHIESIRKVSSDAAKWVMATKPEHWSNALFRGSRYNHFSANVVEFFDWIPVRKESSVALIIDSICSKLMEMTVARREASNAWEDSLLTPTMEQKLKKETSLAQKLDVVCSSETIFEVRGNMVNVINMGNRDCTCRRWEITGLPCSHAIAVLERLGKSARDYITPYFKVDLYRATYSESVNPIPDVHRVTSVFGINLYPPSTRDHKWQKKKPNSQKPDTRALHCSRCKGAGHNKKTCDAHALF